METPTTPSSTVAEVLEVTLPPGARALVAADLHLDRQPSPAHVVAIGELVAAVESWTGPGLVVLAGNTFRPPVAARDGAGDGSPSGPDALAQVLQTHHRLTHALAAFAAGDGRRVMVLCGDRDAFLAWSGPDQRLVRRELGAELGLAVDVVVQTGAGERRLRVEPGHQLDPLASRTDPGNPRETPLTYHLRAELLPAVRRQEASGSGRAPWLSGLDDLDDPATFPRFLASRLAYRKLGRSAWLLAVPVLVLVALALRPRYLRHSYQLHWAVPDHSLRVLLLLVGAGVELALLGGVAVAALRRTWRALAGLAVGEGEREPNRTARDRARGLIAQGYTGMITGHTCRPELAHLGTGFYANAGASAAVVTELPARWPGLGLPPVFPAYHQLSWVEAEAGNDLHVRLYHGRQRVPGGAVVERLVGRASRDLAPSPVLSARLVASWPLGGSWPTRRSGQLRRRRLRRLASLFVAVAGVVSLVSALSEPLRDRLDALRQVLPIAVPQTASALCALGGVGLLMLARGVRRGQRRAWFVTELLLATVAVLDLVKGVDFEEATLALAVAGFLWVERAEFETRADPPRLRGGLAVWAGALVGTVLSGTAALEVGIVIAHRVHRPQLDRFHLGWGGALLATLERMVGDERTYLPPAINRFYAPAVAAVSVGLGLALAGLVLRPVVARRHRESDADLARARAIVSRHGSGTLDYFALRSDKRWWFWGDTVVAYAVHGGTCLVSPDPIGPSPEREPAWRAFRQFADENGWVLGGLGCSQEWLPVYRATGMHEVYAGDEGVVRIDRFSLDGGRMKSLRQAVNRVARRGYTMSFHDPAHLDPALRDALLGVMAKSRRGDVERGFSMTLGRVFDPADDGLLLAVVHAPGPDGAPGAPVAFCQFVPAPGIGGYSLDLMRRDDGDHPNGLVDFAVVETVAYLRARGAERIGLNFATMRAVLAGEAGSGVARRAQAWLLRRMSDSMQVESLWRFNAKFDPDWQPRYAVYDAPENALAVAAAVARAESWWELPLVGRFLVPGRGAGEPHAARGARPPDRGAAGRDRPAGAVR